MAEPLDLAAQLESFVASNYSPSGIVAVAKDGEIVAIHTWGEDDYDVTTPFRVASLTKSFTALALLILRREGQLTLDDAVAAHLPELSVEAPDDWPTLRVRHLLSMAAGLATDNPWGDRQESLSREGLSAMLASGLRLVFPPGSAFEYSNLGYAILGEIITRLSGVDYREFVRERILDPLGLHDTRFAADELAGRAAPGFHREPALPGQPSGWRRQPASGPGAFSSIGGLYSSVRDLVAWAHLYVTREVPAGATFTAADLREAQQPLNVWSAAQAPSPLGGLVRQSYGYGLGIEAFSNHGTLVGHAGGYPGHTAYMCWHLETGYAVIASANGTNSAAPYPARQVLLPLIATAERRSRDTLEPWPETVTAARRIEELVRAVPGSDPAALAERYADLFAENVEPDFPVVRRIEYLQQALVSLGELRAVETPSSPRTPRPSRAEWSLPTAYGRLELYIELAPVAPYGVQTFTATLKNGHTSIELF